MATGNLLAHEHLVWAVLALFPDLDDAGFEVSDRAISDRYMMAGLGGPSTLLSRPESRFPVAHGRLACCEEGKKACCYCFV